MALEGLESRTLLSTLYVDASNKTGVEDGSQAHPFSHIQAAISASAPSDDTIRVSAGVYAESLTVSHSVKILGPNAGVNPNLAARGPEAVIVPPVNNPTSGNLVLVTANNVTIDGLTLDGHNPNLTGGTSLNGVSSEAARGVSNVYSSGKLAVISGLVVQNEVIRNVTLFGVLGDINDYSGSTLAVSSGNAIRNNLIDNVSTTGANVGRGISIEDNFYADVTGNVLTRVTTGIQAIFMLNPNPAGTPSTISGNVVHEYNLGIYLWTIDDDSPAFTVSNNTVSAESGAASANVGIELDRVLGSSGVSLTNNNVSGTHVGIQLFYTPTTRTVQVSGGTLSQNDYGVLLANADATSGTLHAVQANLSGVTVASAKVAGLAVLDTVGNPSAPVTLHVDAGTTVANAPHGVTLIGADARITDAGTPTVTFTATPPPSGATGTATFAFTTNDNVSTPNDLTVKYSLDGGASQATLSPLTLSGLAAGPHTLTLNVTDQAGNVGSTVYRWTVGSAATVQTVAMTASTPSAPATASGTPSVVSVLPSSTGTAAQPTQASRALVRASHPAPRHHAVSHPTGPLAGGGHLHRRGRA